MSAANRTTKKPMTHCPLRFVKRSRLFINLLYSDRLLKNFDPSDNAMIGIAWVTPHHQCLFHMFPEVLKTDCTATRNKENCPFLWLVAKLVTKKFSEQLKPSYPMNAHGFFIGYFKRCLCSCLVLPSLNAI
jgi:hypothetical protein